MQEHRYTIAVSDPFEQRIRKFRHAGEYNTRNAAITEILARGMAGMDLSPELKARFDAYCEAENLGVTEALNTLVGWAIGEYEQTVKRTDDIFGESA